MSWWFSCESIKAKIDKNKLVERLERSIAHKNPPPKSYPKNFMVDNHGYSS